VTPERKKREVVRTSLEESLRRRRSRCSPDHPQGDLAPTASVGTITRLLKPLVTHVLRHARYRPICHALHLAMVDRCGAARRARVRSIASELGKRRVLHKWKWAMAKLEAKLTGWTAPRFDRTGSVASDAAPSIRPMSNCCVRCAWCRPPSSAHQFKGSPRHARETDRVGRARRGPSPIVALAI
jgi:hypothetical protein